MPPCFIEPRQRVSRQRRPLRSARLVALAIAASACAPGMTGDGCRPRGTLKDIPRAGASPGHPDGTLDEEPNGTEEPTGDEATPSEVDVQGQRSAEHVDAAPHGVPAKPERPTAANTGPSGPLSPYTGPRKITEDGATYENFARVGQITIDADDVVLRNFRITSPSQWTILVKPGHSGILLEDGELTGSQTAAIRGVGFTARRLHIHDTDSDAMKTQGIGGPTVVEYCFIEKLGLDSSKPDGNQISSGSSLTKDVTFRYNNVWMPVPGSPNWPGPPYASNACFIHSGMIQNVVIENNWINGGRSSVYCGVPGISVRNNRFGRDYKHRPRKGTCDEWSGNVWDDTGKPVTGREKK